MATDRCGLKYPFTETRCTFERGHKQDYHEARGLDGRLIAMWANEFTEESCTADERKRDRKAQEGRMRPAVAPLVDVAEEVVRSAHEGRPLSPAAVTLASETLRKLGRL